LVISFAPIGHGEWMMEKFRNAYSISHLD